KGSAELEKGAAELKQSLQQEQDRAATLAQELTTARARIAAYETQARRADDQAEELKQAESGAEDLRKSLQQERDRASRLEQDLAAAQRGVETQSTLAANASDDRNKVTAEAEKGAAELKQSLQQEQDRAATLAQELTTARATIFAFEAQARRADDQAAEL